MKNVSKLNSLVPRGHSCLLLQVLRAIEWEKMRIRKENYKDVNKCIKLFTITLGANIKSKSLNSIGVH